MYSHIYVTQATNIASEGSTNETSRNISPSHGSLARYPATEHDCDPRMDETYTDTEIVIITTLSVRLNQYLVPKI